MSGVVWLWAGGLSAPEPPHRPGLGKVNYSPGSHIACYLYSTPRNWATGYPATWTGGGIKAKPQPPPPFPPLSLRRRMGEYFVIEPCKARSPRGIHCTTVVVWLTVAAFPTNAVGSRQHVRALSVSTLVHVVAPSLPRPVLKFMGMQGLELVGFLP
ncbi:hypothetical protein GQ53DRAFT_298772 [Thozetella sp. PMI_491]|nr:hypothetical protein GQ53DRAFT_298772 [Thozetella sp. PMI_491]